MQIKHLTSIVVAAFLVSGDYVPYGTSLKTCKHPGDLALTFDDGPSAEYTEIVLNILKERNIKATFFLVGQMIAGNEDILKRQLAEGHVLASHSYSHPYFQQLGLEDSINQIIRTEAEFMRAVGIKPNYFRFPYGDFNQTTLELLGLYQYKTVYWDLDSLDASEEEYPADDIVENYVSTLENADFNSSSFVALNHDIVENTNVVLNDIIDYILTKGYKFVTVPECFGDSYSPYKDTIIDYNCKFVSSNCGDHCPNNCGKNITEVTSTVPNSPKENKANIGNQKSDNVPVSKASSLELSLILVGLIATGFSFLC